MATIYGLNLSSPRILAQKPDLPRQAAVSCCLSQPLKRVTQFRSGRMMQVPPVRAAPDSISEKVEKSIKEAEQACEGDPTSGECVAAWDEVEELSAAASHARDKKKDSDPLEDYCKDNPETDECRTYDN